jgi:hypothetical protein
MTRQKKPGMEATEVTERHREKAGEFDASRVEFDPYPCFPCSVVSVPSVAKTAFFAFGRIIVC